MWTRLVFGRGTDGEGSGLMAFPVEEKLSAIRRSLANNRDLVLVAPPGSGKTTCVAPALLDEAWLAGRKIVMLEPRRLAARTAADYMARQRDEAVGETIGYQVRLERRVSSATRLEIVTEGLLAQRILSDPELADTGLVIFDEFHERSLACDLAFAFALEVRRALRPDLRLLVMSATLDADEVARHLGDADIIEAEGRMFPITTRYLGEVSVAAACREAVSETDGNILAFLPGEGEIRRTESALENCLPVSPDARPVRVFPLYGNLPKSEQDRVFAAARDSSMRSIILATSIAETSVTIPDISCVIDSGLMRLARFSPTTGMSGLVTVPLTLDRAEQRRGRAGRVRPGVCYRLWYEAAEASRARKANPEILEADLASTYLSSLAWGARRREDLPWLTPPPASSWTRAENLMRLLGAVDETGHLTEKGARMSHLSMHPRLANMCLMGGGETAALLAAIVEEHPKTTETDIRRVADEIRETPNRPASRRVLELARRFRIGSQTDSHFVSEGVLLAQAYPDRVAKGRGDATFRMVSGRGAFLNATDALAKSPYLVCCELDDRPGDAKIFLAAPLTANDLDELFADQIREVPYCAWDRAEERVRCVLRRQLGELTLSEKPQAADAADVSEQVAEALLEGIRLKGVAALSAWTRESRQKWNRMMFVARTLGDEANPPWPVADEGAVREALRGFITGMTRWRDLERLDLSAVLESMLVSAGHSGRELDRLAPTRIEVPSGSHILVHYEGVEPTAEVRLQECFGLMETPRVMAGRVPVVMTLLSPAQRPVQVTKDLKNFWREGYPLVRKDLRGRYPRHYWPEDPYTAIATRRVNPHVSPR